ncbi:MAG TPA: hypothetical protein VK711_07550, partial [Puia sp.]|nr:hypothetical protein [Puia sp.]
MKSLLISLGFMLSALQAFCQVTPNKDSSLKKQLIDSIRIKNPGLFLDPVEITAIRAGDKSPFTKVNLGAAQI